MCKSVVTLLLAFATVAIVNAQNNVNPCRGRPDGYARDIQSCAHYWVCANGQANGRDVCTQGKFFDAETEQCRFRDQVKCFQCPQNEYRLFSVPRACSQYLLCFLGTVSLNSCPNGLVFDGRNHVRSCNYEPYPGGCYRENDSEGGGDDPVVQRCPYVHDKPVYVHDKYSCSVYYVCTKTDEVPQRRQCDSNLHFNNQLGVCDRPEKANCPIQGPPSTERPQWPTHTPPTGRPTSRPPPPLEGAPAWPCPVEGGIYVPDRFHCNVYHACIRGGSSQLQRCDSGFNFDMNSRTCKLARDAQCFSNSYQTETSNDSVAVYEREPQDSSSSEEGIYCRNAKCGVENNAGEVAN